jgi:adenosine/AMP kinase
MLLSMALSRLVSDDPCRRVEQAAIQCECSPSDLNAFLIGTERFKTTLEDFKGIFGDEQATLEIGVAFFDALPRLVL